MAERLPLSSWATILISGSRAGFLQTLLIAISLFVLAQHCFSRLAAQNGTICPYFKDGHRILLCYELPTQLLHLATFAAFILATVHESWQGFNALLVGYIWALTFLRSTTRVTGWRHHLLHQTNSLLVGTFLVVFCSEILPSVNDGKLEDINVAMLIRITSLAVLLTLAAITPREWIHPSGKELHDSQYDESQRPSAEETCSWFSHYVSYSYLNKLIYYSGDRSALTIESLPALPWFDHPALLLSRLRSSRECGRNTLWTIMHYCRLEIAIMAIWAMLSFPLHLVSGLSMYHLLACLSNRDSITDRPGPEAWVWLALMFLGPMARSATYQRYLFTSTRVIIQIKSAMTQELYQKALTSMELDPHDPLHVKPGEERTGSKSTTSAGKMANLMAADIDALWQARDIVGVIFGAPVGILASGTGLYWMVGWPALMGIFFLALMTPVATKLSNIMGDSQRRVKAMQDARISMVGECLTNIRPIKYFAWENVVAKLIGGLRGKEQGHQWRINLLWTMIHTVTQFMQPICLVAVLYLHSVVRGQRLTPAIGFTLIAFIRKIRMDLEFVSATVKYITAAQVSLQRLDRYFESVVPTTQYPIGPLKVQAGHFRRHRAATFSLVDLTIHFIENGLTVVKGPSGSGKTTLLLSILGECIKESGLVTRPTDVAFASQTPWLQNESVKDNILFHAEFQPVRYQKVLAACCLEEDILAMADGHDTECGEDGNKLSGGQRARVALARSLYSKAPLLLLDDVFSALDAKTAALIWKNCFCTALLANRTVVFVTQIPWITQQADLVVSLSAGKITAQDQNLGVVRRPVKFTATEPEILGGDLPAEDTSSSSDGPSRPTISSNESETVPSDTGEPSRQALLRRNSAEHKTIEAEMRGTTKTRTGWAAFRYLSYFGPAWYRVLPILGTIATVLVVLNTVHRMGVWVDEETKYHDGPNHDDRFQDAWYYLALFFASNVAGVTVNGLTVLAYEYGAWSAARELHANLTEAILGVSLSWYSSTPVGRVINRFSRDMSSLDTAISRQFQQSIDGIIRFLGRLLAVSSIIPTFCLPALISSFLGALAGYFYTSTTVVLKRLVGSAQSPVFSQFSSSLSGQAVIRGQSHILSILCTQLSIRLALWARAAEANANCNRWVAVRIDCITVTVTVFAGALATYYSRGIDAGVVGFSLNIANGLSETIIQMVRAMNDLEIELQSFNRVEEYAFLESEDEQNYSNDNDLVGPPGPLPEAWPTTGKIEFKNVTVRYSPEGPDILKNINLTFHPGQRVAIIGRTGSGKSTLLVTLLRFANVVSGQILYDGVDISSLPRRKLREAITIIPQEATIFSGTVQSNLDPCGEVPRAELEHILESCAEIASFKYHGRDDNNGNGNTTTNGNADESATTSGLTLDTPVAVKGENFSHGQLQVLSLCRALARNNKVMLLDEATASMDYETDCGVQALLRQAVAGQKTLVTVAHHLRTIVDYDRVVALKGGRVVEDGAPRELYEAKGKFWEMVGASGEGEGLRELLMGI